MNHKVPIEVSARHIHLSPKDGDILFGSNYYFQTHKKLSQPEQMAAKEIVEIIGPKNKISQMRVIIPLRSQTQLEISATDAYNLGIEAMLRLSGDLQGSSGGLKISGPRGQLDLRSGIIIARRHLHIEPERAEKWGLQHGQIISIKTLGQRSVTFHQVIVRSEAGKDTLAFHLDTDEANAAGVKNGDMGKIMI